MSREYRLTCQMWLPLPLEKVFSFFADARHIPQLTPPWLQMTIRCSGEPVMRNNVALEYAIIWLHIPIRWETRISIYTPPRQFRDEQLRGPFLKWVHTHRFWSEDQGCVIFDEVLYRLPWGSLGLMAHHFFIRRRLADIFNFRQRIIPELLLGAESGKARQIEPVIIRRQA